MYSEERSDPELAVLLPRVAGDDEDNHGARHQLTGINGTDELQHDRMREEVGKMRTLTLDAYVSSNRAGDARQRRNRRRRRRGDDEENR